MAELLKNTYSREYLNQLSNDIWSVYPEFQSNEFVESVMSEPWSELELKGRVRQITLNLGKFLPSDYCAAIEILDKAILKRGSWLNRFARFLSDFVEVFGQNEADWDVSIAALERYTSIAPAEFAVRPFILNNQERMMAQMYEWSKSENEHVRRLASEGCRVKLPLGSLIPAFKQDPTPIFTILEQLKSDPSELVRRSVANNLNDISKIHPKLVLKLAKDWLGESKHTNQLVRRACRTLLKIGDVETLELLGYDNVDCAEISNFRLKNRVVTIGDDFEFSFDILVKKEAKIRLEYTVDFAKANSRWTQRTFYIMETQFNENEQRTYREKLTFRNHRRRVNHPGMHTVRLIVNGVQLKAAHFEVIARGMM